VFTKAFQRWAGFIAAAVVLVAVTAGLMMYLLDGGAFLRSGGLASSVATPDQPGPPQFPRMVLQAQYAGPLVGTMIQRLRDPVDGTICYLYLPMVVQHTPAPSGYVQYGANSIGSISCMAGTPAAH
jgi:hypothetical protein